MSIAFNSPLGRKLPQEDLVAWFKYVRGDDYTQEELIALVNFVKE